MGRINEVGRIVEVDWIVGVGRIVGVDWIVGSISRRENWAFAVL